MPGCRWNLTIYCLATKRQKRTHTKHKCIRNKHRSSHFSPSELVTMRNRNENKEQSKTQYGPRPANLVLIAYASSEGSGEPARPRSLARTFAARSYKQWIKRNFKTENQTPGPSEWLGMRSENLSWQNARRHKFAWRGSYGKPLQVRPQSHNKLEQDQNQRLRTVGSRSHREEKVKLRFLSTNYDLSNLILNTKSHKTFGTHASEKNTKIKLITTMKQKWRLHCQSELKKKHYLKHDGPGQSQSIRPLRTDESFKSLSWCCHWVRDLNSTM